MRVLVIYAHPVETSYASALHAAVLRGLGARHDVRDLDLYAEDFDPRLTRAERMTYHDTALNVAPVARYVDLLRWAEGVVFCFPVWSFGVPAILKGFFDRVLIPGVAFDLDGGRVAPKLTHVTHIVAVATYGRSRWATRLSVGDLPRAQIARHFRWFCGRGTSVRYLALYGMNVADDAARAGFLARVQRTVAAL
jgi:NAD(P)H dehydrogenase (quinone)